MPIPPAKLEGRPIRGLTLHRPWAWAFRHAGKTVENRRWTPPKHLLGGFVALHSGFAWDEAAYEKMRTGFFGDRAKLVPIECYHQPGMITGVARLRGWTEVPLARRVVPRPDPFEFGPFAWNLDEFRWFDTPILCRGFQRLWNVHPSILKEIEKQCRAVA